MNRAFLVVAVATLALAACQNNPVCINCPDLTGSWNVTYSNDESTGDCSAYATSGADGSVLNISQNGSALTSALYGFSLSGTLFQNLSFSLQGSNSVGGVSDAGTSAFASLDLEGTAVVPDAGTATLTGTLTGNQSDSTGVNITCTLDRDFTAVR